MKEQGLIGMWSVDRRYGPGAMSDTYLAFLPDGRGFLEYANPVSAYVEAFRWSGAESRTVTISGTASYEVEYEGDEQRVVESPGHLQFENLPFRIELEDTPRGETMEVLTLDEESGRWRKCLAGMMVPEKYGRIRHSFEGYRPPAFLRS
jgi:hypothetical protein